MCGISEKQIAKGSKRREVYVCGRPAQGSLLPPSPDDATWGDFPLKFPAFWRFENGERDFRRGLCGRDEVEGSYRWGRRGS